MQKTLLIILFALYTFSAIAQKGKSYIGNPAKDSIAGKAVSFYLNHKDCANLAKDFYYGKFRPTDDDSTAKLLSFVTTDNSELRPFYRWILNETIEISDGALGEYIGIPARKYAEKFPIEFFEYIEADNTEKFYANWIKAIHYSGFYDYENYNDSVKLRSNLVQAMKSNCKDCDRETISKIVLFSSDLW